MLLDPLVYNAQSLRLSDILSQEIKLHAYPVLQCLSLFAYLPQRGTIECLLRVSYHCRDVRQCCQEHLTDPISKALFGGTQVSLDMEQAFASVSRAIVQRALQLIQFPHDVLNMI